MTVSSDLHSKLDRPTPGSEPVSRGAECAPVCVLCNSPLHEQGLVVTDYRLGVEGYWHVGRCAKCDIEQSWPLPAAGDLEWLYSTYYSSGTARPHDARYRSIRERFLASGLGRAWNRFDGDISFVSQCSSSNQRLLDVGCNDGRNLQRFRQNGFRAEGLEFNPVAAGEARSRGFNVHTVPIGSAHPDPGSFDVVVLSNVIEHTVDPRAAISWAYGRLKPGGQLWLSCPNRRSVCRRLFGVRWINWHPPFHRFHFSVNGLVSLLTEQGFEVKAVETTTPALWLAQSAIGFAAPTGRESRWLRSPVLLGSVALTAKVVLAPLLWFADSRGLGDCIRLQATRDDACAY